MSPFGRLLAYNDPSFLALLLRHVLASFGITYFWAPSLGACARFSLSRFLFVHFVICFSDVLMSGIWNEVAVLEDPSLRSLVPDLGPRLP